MHDTIVNIVLALMGVPKALKVTFTVVAPATESQAAAAGAGADVGGAAAGLQRVLRERKRPASDFIVNDNSGQMVCGPDGVSPDETLDEDSSYGPPETSQESHERTGSEHAVSAEKPADKFPKSVLCSVADSSNAQVLHGDDVQICKSRCSARQTYISAKTLNQQHGDYFTKIMGGFVALAPKEFQSRNRHLQKIPLGDSSVLTNIEPVKHAQAGNGYMSSRGSSVAGDIALHDKLENLLPLSGSG